MDGLQVKIVSVHILYISFFHFLQFMLVRLCQFMLEGQGIELNKTRQGQDWDKSGASKRKDKDKISTR